MLTTCSDIFVAISNQIIICHIHIHMTFSEMLKDEIQSKLNYLCYFLTFLIHILLLLFFDIWCANIVSFYRTVRSAATALLNYWTDVYNKKSGFQHRPKLCLLTATSVFVFLYIQSTSIPQICTNSSKLSVHINLLLYIFCVIRRVLAQHVCICYLAEGQTVFVLIFVFDLKIIQRFALWWSLAQGTQQLDVASRQETMATIELAMVPIVIHFASQDDDVTLGKLEVAWFLAFIGVDGFTTRQRWDILKNTHKKCFLIIVKTTNTILPFSR